MSKNAGDQEETHKMLSVYCTTATKTEKEMTSLLL